MFRICILALFFASYVFSHPDEVTDLPGLTETVNFHHYSGYLNASNGKFLHYWFVESERSPSEDPVLLWLNGGPGCSSMEGFLAELGPFHVNTDGRTLYMNPFSWNKVANVLFLEAPAGVGYSYSESGEYDTDDDTVSLDNYLALQHFFVKFPNFKGNDFYISGESYGGIYIPTLSVRVLTGPANINFKGFAIGNGYLDVSRISNSIVFFAYYHGLVGQKTWDSVVKYCCDGGASTRYKCDFVQNVTSDCKKGVTDILKTVQSSGLDIYNLYADCVDSAAANSRGRADFRTVLKAFTFYNQELGSDPPCSDSSNMTFYLNQKSVRSALHIPPSLPDWELCSSDVEAGYRRVYDTMTPQILTLIGSHRLRGLIYNGDVDMACNFLGDEWFFEDLELQVVKGFEPWKYNNQIAGFSKSYRNLTYATIKGSGHMVPQDKPGPALKMISNFLANKPL